MTLGGLLVVLIQGHVAGASERYDFGLVVRRVGVLRLHLLLFGLLLTARLLLGFRLASRIHGIRCGLVGSLERRLRILL